MSLDPSERLIHSLSETSVYEHPVERIQVLETHISWVLLTGPYAYKIKKPVDFGFVDFTTLQRRQFFCSEELRLNRRLADELYLAVVPICGTVEQPDLNGAGEPIEFAVKMRQFPQDALLSRVLKRGELTPRHIDQLAREVAEFHRRISVAADESRFGNRDAVYEPMAENFRHLELAGDDPSQRSLIQKLQEWSEREFAARRDDFVSRKRDGFVRECHGDMHLGNMILQKEFGVSIQESEIRSQESAASSRDSIDDADAEDAVLIFDCIEFNESLRWIDVMSEVAFVVMDLEDRGRADLGRRFLTAYLELTGDYGGLRVLPFYLVYRALVRAKVASLRGAQDDLEDNERQKLGREFAAYLDQAVRYTKPPRPRLMIAHGCSGSGKTTGTQPLVEQFGAIRLRSDVERKRLFCVEPDSVSPVPRESGVGRDIYTAEATEKTYTRLAELASVVVRAGFTAVIDATFLRRRFRDDFRRLADELGVDFLILDFRADEKTLCDRVQRRAQIGRDASEADVAVLKHQLQTREPLGPDESAYVIEVDGTDPEAAALLTTAVRSRRR